MNELMNTCVGEIKGGSQLGNGFALCMALPNLFITLCLFGCLARNRVFWQRNVRVEMFNKIDSGTCRRRAGSALVAR
jgi:hypothetical protein